MARKARLEQLATDLDKSARPKVRKRTRAKATTEPNPERGLRGDYLKVTITLPPEMLADLRTAGIELRAQGEKNTGVSEMIRRAVAGYLQGRA